MYELSQPSTPEKELSTAYKLPKEFIGKKLPTMYDLPSESPEEPGLPDEFHALQPRFLSETCQTTKYTPQQMLMAMDLNLYYTPEHTLWHKRPDWYVVVNIINTQQLEDLRYSYVTWEEKQVPLLIVELLSPGTEKDDLGERVRKINEPPTKWQVYEEILKVPYYVIYDRRENQLQVFRHNGTSYQQAVLRRNRFWVKELELGLGLWEGNYEGTNGLWLRWYDFRGWIPSRLEKISEERRRADEQEILADEERRRADEERRRADEAEMKSRILAQKLRELNIDPDSL